MWLFQANKMVNRQNLFCHIHFNLHSGQWESLISSICWNISPVTAFAIIASCDWKAFPSIVCPLFRTPHSVVTLRVHLFLHCWCLTGSIQWSFVPLNREQWPKSNLLTLNPIFLITLHGSMMPFQNHCHVFSHFFQLILATLCFGVSSVQLAGPQGCAGLFLTDRMRTFLELAHLLWPLAATVALQVIESLIHCRQVPRSGVGRSGLSTVSDLLLLLLASPGIGANGETPLMSPAPTEVHLLSVAVADNARCHLVCVLLPAYFHVCFSSV